MVNVGPTAVAFVIQEPGDRWEVLVDTAKDSPEDIELDRPNPLIRPSYTVETRALVVLRRSR
jgi:hypothetical protein